MEKLQSNGVALFDTHFTNNHICMMKILLPLLPPILQKNIAIYIKYLELQYTMRHFHRLMHTPSQLSDELTATDKSDFSSVFEEILSYCTPQEKQTFTQMRNIHQTFQNMKEMMEMLETMKELFPETFDGSCGSLNPEILAGMSGLSPELFASMSGLNPEVLASMSGLNPETPAGMSSMFGGQHGHKLND